jgi:hypothetical protein
LENFVQNRIKEIEENEECDDVELGSVCEKIKPKFNINSNELDNNGVYPFYNKVGENIGYHSKYNYDTITKCILLTKDGGSGPNIYGDNIALGSVMKLKGKFASTYANFVLKLTYDNINYIYYLLKTKKNAIMDLANYSVKIGHIQYNKLSQLKMKLPKNKQLMQDLEPTFQQIETLQNDVKNADELYKRFIQELSQEAMPQHNVENIPAIRENIEFEFEEEKEQEQELIIPKKKTSKKSIK